MKKFILTLAAALCCALTTTVFTACGSDDDDTKPNGSDTKYVVNMYFDVALEQGLYDFCDVYCTFTNKDGEVQTIQMPGPKGKYDQTVDYDKAPEDYEFSMYAVPKEKLPEIDTTAAYDFHFTYNVLYRVSTADNPKGMVRGIMVEYPDKSGGLNVPGRNVMKHLDRHRESYVLVKKMTGKKSK
ncbi:MAG: hypothetical protein J5545_12565 [Bacteroidaceae bacterium]|nr:hypothetical protein [Bacteroidaceae bacterium]